ncbi:MAG: hypothetical protein IKE55_03450 [Kiritimatiellae bacterium]|nr:hypothetical protein [Kiritimatiellia bacterium]
MTCFSRTISRIMIFAYAFLLSARAGTWGEVVRTTGVDPVVVHMATTYTPQYLVRDGGCGNGIVGRFRFGEEARNVQGEETCANDDGRHCYIKRRKMYKDEYREFKDMSLFFRKEGGNLLYKIVIEQTFSCETQGRDRATTMNGIVEDCKLGYGLLLDRAVACDGQVVYLCSDDVFEIRMELNKMKDGERRLSLSVMNKKVRDGKIATPAKSLPQAFNADGDIEVSI